MFIQVSAVFRQTERSAVRSLSFGEIRISHVVFFFFFFSNKMSLELCFL